MKKRNKIAQLIEWAKNIDPDIEVLESPYDSWIEFGGDSVFRDQDSIINVADPKILQILGEYMGEEFLCAWRYKNTTFWATTGAMWGIAHEWIVNGFPVITTMTAYFSSNEDMIKYVIMSNDGHLPDTKSYAGC